MPPDMNSGTQQSACWLTNNLVGAVIAQDENPPVRCSAFGTNQCNNTAGKLRYDVLEFTLLLDCEDSRSDDGTLCMSR